EIREAVRARPGLHLEVPRERRVLLSRRHCAEPAGPRVRAIRWLAMTIFLLNKRYPTSVSSSMTASAEEKSSSRKYSLRVMSTGMPADAAAFRPLAESSMARHPSGDCPNLESASR